MGLASRSFSGLLKNNMITKHVADAIGTVGSPPVMKTERAKNGSLPSCVAASETAKAHPMDLTWK